MSTNLQVKPAGTPTWIDLISPDAEASRKFYQAVFGWEYDIGGPEFGGYATARLGTRSVAGVVGNQPGAPELPAAWGLYFATQNIQADVDRAVQLGAKVTYPIMPVGAFGSMGNLEDPTGAAFNLWQAGQHVGFQVTNEPGAPAWHELYTQDAKRARDFYNALLKTSADLMPGGMEYYTLKHTGDPLAGIMQIDPAWGNMPAQWVTYFGVANVDETVAKVQQNGGRIMGNIDDSPFGRIAALADNVNATFKIVEMPKG